MCRLDPTTQGLDSKYGNRRHLIDEALPLFRSVKG